MNALHAGRNDACPCGSGKKFRRCCLPVQTLLEERGGVPLVSSFDAAADRQQIQPKPHGVPPWFVEESENRVLKTTAEHPFYVYGKGWTPACEIKDGDLIRTDIGWVTVNGSTDTGRYEAVYNVRVADCHTYFVGAEGWGFSVWAHNAYDVQQAANARHQKWANDQAAIESTLARLGQRALRGGGDWRAAEARFQRYAALVESRLTRTGSRFAVEVEPAAFRGSNGRRAESWTQPDRYNPGMREWMSVRGSRRPDIGLVDTTQLDPVGNPYRVVAGFDITTNPYKPSIGRYYQEAFGAIRIYDIRASGVTVHR